MNKVVFVELVVVLALGWMVVIASIVGPWDGPVALWVVGFLIALTLSIVLIHWLPDGRPGKETSALAERLVESRLGKVMIALLSLNLVVGTGSVLGVLLCVLVQGVAATIAGLPGILGTAIAGAALSMVGFAIFTLLLSLLGPILSVVYEGWVGYIAPVVGGVAGAAIASGYVGGGIGIVGTGALVGALAQVVFGVSTSKKRVKVKDVGELLTAGLGFGFINGLILALIFWVLKALR
jgi:hypothetical protein